MASAAKRLQGLRAAMTDTPAVSLFIGSTLLFALAFHEWISPRSAETGVSYLFTPNALLLLLIFHADGLARRVAVYAAFIVAALGWAAANDDSLIGSAPYLAINLFYVTLVAVALIRFGTPRLALRRPHSVAIFFGITTVGAILSGAAAGAVAASVQTDSAIVGDAFFRVWSEWTFGDATAMLTIAATAFALTRANMTKIFAKVRANFLEFAAAVVLLLAAVTYDFEFYRLVSDWSDVPQPHPSLLFATTPAIVWLAMRFRQLGAAVAVMLSSFPAIHFVNAGYGPIWLSEADDRVLTMQAYLASVGLSAFAISALAYQIDARERLSRYALMAARRRARDRADFFATFNHEMRTPLNAILGFTHLMRTEANGPLHREYKDYVVEIDQAAKRLFNLTIDVLKLNKMRRGDFELETETIALEPLCADVGAGMIGMAQARRVTLENRVSTGLALDANALALRQALSNLLSNAIRHTPPNGRVVISSRFSARGLCLDVRDTGEGFDPDLVMGEMRMRRGDNRAGFGLQITDTIMTLHDGAMQIVSQPGGGSCVTLVFPAARVVERSATDP